MAKDDYTGPTPEQMDKAARMMEKNIPPVAPSKLEPKAPVPPTQVPVKKAKGGKVSSASSRADGIAQKGKTKGRMC